MSARAVLRRAVPAVAAGSAVVAVLASVRPRLEVGPATTAAGTPRPPADVRRVSTRAAPRPGPRSTATGTAIATPFSVVQVRVTLTAGRLTRIETVALTGENARSDALNHHAEPILRAEALRAGDADIDVVSGATYTSRSYIGSLQSALDRARRAG